MISSEDARMIINKWNQESLPVRCDVLIDGGIRFSLVGTVNLLTDQGFGIRASDERNWILLPFMGVHYYEYGDSRMAKPEVKEFIAETYEALLTFTTGFAIISIGELKESATRN